MFKSKSNPSSKRSSRQSSRSSSPINFHSQNPDMEQPENHIYEETLNNSNDKILKTFLQIQHALNCINYKNPIKDVPYFNIGEFATNFNKIKLNEEQIMNSSIKESIEDKVNSEKMSMLENELCMHKLNPLVKCPDRFSPFDTLRNSYDKMINLNRLLPQGRNKFSGAKDGPNKWCLGASIYADL